MDIENTSGLMEANISSWSLEESRNAVQIATAGLFLLLIIFLCFIGNSLVIAGICSFHKLKEDKSNKFILNLAVTDLLSGVLVMVTAFVSLVSDKWLFGYYICQFVCAANYCLIIVSMLTLCFISVDRYQAVIHGLHYHRRITTKRICLMIAYSWFQGIVFALVPLVETWVRYDYWEVICAIEWHSDPRTLYYVIFAFVMCFLIPGIILVRCYHSLLLAAKRSRIRCLPAAQQSHNQVAGQSQGPIMSTKASKTFRSLLCVVLAYFVCLTPFCVTKLIKVIFPAPNIVPGYVNLMASWFGYMSSAVNPMIYGIFRKDFRAAYIKILRKIPFLFNKEISTGNAIPSLNTAGDSTHESQHETSS